MLRRGLLIALVVAAAVPADASAFYALKVSTVASPSGRVNYGTTVTYTTTVTNASSDPYPCTPQTCQPICSESACPSGIDDVVSLFLDRYPSGVGPFPATYDSVTPSQGTCAQQATRPPSVECNPGPLAPGASMTITATVLAKRSMYDSVAVVNCAFGGGDCATHSAGDVVTLVTPACIVPKIIGLKVGVAETQLVHAHCRLGKVTRKKTRRAKRGRVLRQRPAAGAVLPNNTRVAVTVGHR